MGVPAPVVVVGAGPTGLVAALLLARRGVDVTVLERRTGVHRLPRAVHLDDESARILQAAGVGDAFAGISRAAAGLRLLDARLRPFAEFRRADRGVHGWPESNLFDQPDLEEVLRSVVARTPRVTLREGVEVAGVEVAGLDPDPGGSAGGAMAGGGTDGGGSTGGGSVGGGSADIGSAGGGSDGGGAAGCGSTGGGSAGGGPAGIGSADGGFAGGDAIGTGSAGGGAAGTGSAGGGAAGVGSAGGSAAGGDSDGGGSADVRSAGVGSTGGGSAAGGAAGGSAAAGGGAGGGAAGGGPDGTIGAGAPGAATVGGVVVRLASGERVAAAAVLGCDGARSTVRTAIGARMRTLGAPQRWFVLDVRCARPLPSWGGVDQVCDPARAATFLALTGDRYRWEFRMRTGETADDLAARVPGLTARWAPGALEVLRAGEYTFAAEVADRWSRDRTFLLGDAAHLTPPFIGQGLGAGLRDAHNLAWKLAAVLRDGAPESWLDGYRSERALHADTMIRGALRIGRAMTGGSGAIAALRRPVVAGALRVPAVRRRAAAGLVTRFGPGPLVDRRRDRRDPVGTVCPQPWPGHDALLGDGWALIAGSAPISDDLTRRAEAVEARPVRTTEPTLLRWLADARVRAVLIRPDRIVAASAPA